MDKKVWYIYTMEYYSAIEKNAFESVLMKWMNLEPFMQSEVSQKEKHQHSILTHIYAYYLLPTQNSHVEASSKSGLNDSHDSGLGHLL